MDSYKKLLEDLINAKNIPGIEGLLDYVLPHLGTRELEDTKSQMSRSLDDPAKSLVVKVIADRVGYDEALSRDYVLSRIEKLDLDRSEIDFHIDNLGGYFSQCLASAILRGDVEIAKKVDLNFSSLYPVRLAYESTGSFSKGLCANGLEVNSDLVFEGFDSPADVEDIFEIVIRSGMIEMLGRGNDGSAWLLGKRLRKGVMMTGSVKSPSLPTISHGVVHDYELALSLNDRANASSYPELYEKCLVWVQSSEVEAVPGVIIDYRRDFTLGYDHVNVPSRDGAIGRSVRFDFDQFNDAINNGDSYLEKELYRNPVSGLSALSSFKLGLDARSDNRADKNVFHDLAQNMLTPEQRLGFLHPKGKTLMMMAVTDVLGFELSGMNTIRQVESEKFCDEYFPVGMLISLRDKKTVMTNDEVRRDIGIDSTKPWFLEDFISRLSDPASCESLMSVIPRDLVYKNIGQALFVVDEKSLSLAVANTGYTFKGSSYSMNRDQAVSLCKAGVAFDKFDIQDGFKKIVDFGAQTNRTHESYVAAIKMGLWPGKQSEMNLSIKEALTLAVRLKNEIVYKALLDAVGVEGVAPFVKTEAHYRTVHSIFGSDGLRPVLNELPSKFRDSLFSEDLGL